MVIPYTYDVDGNWSTAAGINFSANNLNEYTAAGATGYSYDADGNLTAGGGYTYTYDDDNRLIGMTSATDTWAYQYDGLGNRISATHNGTVTQYVNDLSGLGNVEAELNGSGQLVSHYTYGLDLTSSVPASGSAAYYTFDGAGNTAQMTNASGSVVNSYSYLPFGQKLASTTGVANPFTFVGEYGVMDEGSGLYFMRNRLYDPALGRFVQQDPIGFAGGTNLYSYSGNSPLTYSDPVGTCPTKADVIDAGNHALNALSGTGVVAGIAGNVSTIFSLVQDIHNGDATSAAKDSASILARTLSLAPAETIAATEFVGLKFLEKAPATFAKAVPLLGQIGILDETSQAGFNGAAALYY